MTNKTKESINSLILAGLLSITLTGDIKKSDHTPMPSEIVTKDEYYNSATINAHDYDNLLWVNLLNNVESLTISVDSADELKELVYLPKLERLIIKANKLNNDYNNNILTFDNCKFLKHSHKLKALCIEDFVIEDGLLESLKSVETLYLATNKDSIATNYYFNYHEMTKLKTLIVNKPYSLLIHMDKNNIMDIIDKDIIIKHPYDDYTFEDITKDVLKTYEEIVSMTDKIPVNDIDKEKTIINKIINYLAMRYSYDKEFTGEGRDREKAFWKFYRGGYLYGIFHSDKILCGNYAALFSALAKEYGIDSIIVMSDTHAWNIVSIDGCIYKVDPTARKVKLSSIEKEREAAMNLPIDDSSKIYKRVY